MDQLLDALRAMRRDLGLEIAFHALYTQVDFDDERVSLHSRNAGGAQALRVQFAWAAIRRVCCEIGRASCRERVSKQV